MNGQNTGGSLPTHGTEAETELSRQLNQLFAEIDRTKEIASILHNRLHFITKASVPNAEKPGQDNLTVSLSPLADALRTKGIELMQANNSINDLMNRLAI